MHVAPGQQPIHAVTHAGELGIGAGPPQGGSEYLERSVARAGGNLAESQLSMPASRQQREGRRRMVEYLLLQPERDSLAEGTAQASRRRALP